MHEMEVPVPKGRTFNQSGSRCMRFDYPRTHEHGTSSGIYPLTIGHEFAAERLSQRSLKRMKLIGTKSHLYPLIPASKWIPGKLCQVSITFI